MNTLYYGDNLDILRRYIQDESVDLIYLDPPFKSQQDYNVLFAEKNGTRSAAQIKAFEDTWHWDQAAATAYQEVVEAGGKVSQAMQAFRQFLGDTDMLAYLAMMAPRLVELRRILKPTGSIYLHCDPAASHYLKLLMDAIFSPGHLLNEIVWPRLTAAKAQTAGFGRTHDIILFYRKTSAFLFNRPTRSLSEQRVKQHYSNIEPETGRRYMLADFTQAGPGASRRFGQRMIAPPAHKHWIWSQARIDKAMKSGRLVFTNPDVPRIKRYLDETKGDLVEDVWRDILPINAMAKERLGYPTQKPEALLERIIQASSNEGDTILDPFCGCGTAIAVAQKLNRKWIGIDITHLAIMLIRHRLRDAFGDEIVGIYEVIGEPVSSPDARALAEQDAYQFQWWALGLVGARSAEQKKGSDQGIDGRLYFHDEAESGRTKQIIFSVKSGAVTVAHVRDLRGVVEREKAAIGVLISLEEPTRAMRTEAAGAGFYKSPWGQHSRLQILTITELLEGKRIDYPPSKQVNVTFKKAPKAEKKKAEQLPLTE